MKKKSKKIWSLILVLILLVTSVNVLGIKSNAEVLGVDLSGVTAEVNTVKDGDQQLINALTSETYELDGISYKNYIAYEGVTAIASSEMRSAYDAIDLNTGTRWETEHGTDPHYLQVDLGNVYSLKKIAIYWEAASAKEYEVEVSADGSTFTKLTDVTSTIQKRTDEISLSKEINVRAVRINCLSRTTGYGNSIYDIGFYGLEEQKEVVPVLSNLKIKDYYKYTGKYILYFDEPEETMGYNVYLDDSREPIKKIGGSGDYICAKDLENVTEGEHTLYITNLDESGQESARIGARFNLSDSAGTYTDMPQIYIESKSSISSEYQKNDDVTITVVDKDGGSYEDIFDNECNIKIRGNTTAGAPKKPWNIKFSGKTKVLGMNKGKKWCLLANSFDKSLMRNSLSYDLGILAGVNYNCESRFVEVYVNGTFNGNYLLTEPVEAKKERVDIDAYNVDSNDILLELGTRNEPDVNHFTTSTLGTTFDVNDPEKDDDLTDEQLEIKINRVNKYLSEFEETLKNQDYDEILTYMDEDTFVNFYIVNELFKNVDFNFSSTRFYIKNDVIYAGPMWDLDLSSGNCKSSYYESYYVDGVSYKGYYCNSMKWYKQLLKNETFYNKVKARYKELQYDIQNIYMNNSETAISIDNLVNVYGKSFERNYLGEDLLGAGWSLTNDDGYSYAGESGWTRWQDPIEFLRDWLRNRNAWLCEEWEIDMVAAYEESKPREPETTIPETTTVAETTTAVETITVVETTSVETTTAANVERETTTQKIVEPTTKKKPITVKRTKIKKVSKKKNSKKVKISLKKIIGATGYIVKISSSKKFKGKKRTVTKKVKKIKFVVISKKLKKNSKYYIKARAYKKIKGVTYYGRWSKIKRIRVKNDINKFIY